MKTVYQKKTTKFTSDLHLFHKNILKFNPETRQGEDCFEMSKILVMNWNESVHPDDIIFILGDVSFGTEENTFTALNLMNGRKKLILGNHDFNIRKSEKLRSCFESIDNYREINVEGTRMVLFHFPIESWNGWHYGHIHLHGHVHGRCGTTNMKNRFDVGVDNRKDKLMIPWTYDEVMANLGTIETDEYKFRKEGNR